ncbi:signal recognition particle 9 [Arctopsyche grandis]|uniref:signal recognition particle 9 n=1 Tax=Arctopsyche grandis TaxID=121162 RepID=UPI00406D8AF7
MTFINSWHEFEKSAERMCLENPSKVRYSMKYNHSKGLVELKVTDNVKCLQYRTELHQDLRKIDNFALNFMRMMV